MWTSNLYCGVVLGRSPTGEANDRTMDSGSINLGSNPSKNIRGSSSGRTPRSGRGNWGSNPCPRAYINHPGNLGGLYIFGGCGIRTWEGVGKREFPVAEILKPRGFKERAKRATGSSEAESLSPSQIVCCEKHDSKYEAAVRERQIKKVSFLHGSFKRLVANIDKFFILIYSSTSQICTFPIERTRPI